MESRSGVWTSEWSSGFSRLQGSEGLGKHMGIRVLPLKGFVGIEADGVRLHSGCPMFRSTPFAAVPPLGWIFCETCRTFQL